MNSKTIAVIAVFAALTVSLYYLAPIKISAPYATFLIYQVWEIPIVVAFLLFGPRVGVAVTTINTIVLLAVFPGALPIGPLYNLAAVLSMLLGIYLTVRYVAKSFNMQSEALLVASSTALGSVVRVGIMSIMNWSLLRYPYPIGFNMPDGALIAMLPLIGLFNFTIVLYTVPIGHFLARVVSAGTKTTQWGQTFKKD
jgi:riboflavin transporter FmnP